MKIDQMRRDYTIGGLDEKDIDRDPMVQFSRWFAEAQAKDLPEWVEINAMTLSTTDLSGQVTSRIVLLKGFDADGFVFFTNYRSQKGRQIADNPQASLCFYWPHLQRQIRVEGAVTRTSRQQSEDYFHSRPRGSQLGALVSEQSSEITRPELESRMAELEKKYSDAKIPNRTPVPCPDHWGGYLLSPRRIEFWQGRPSRLHDRLVYQQTANGGQTTHGWQVKRFAP